MGIRVDYTTVLLLFAPLLLPRIFSVGAKVVSRLSHKPTAGSRDSTSRAATGYKIGFTRRSTAAVLVALYSAYALLYDRPFNVFTSLGAIPLTAPTSKIQALLALRGLSSKYEDDLNLLNSLDIRALYLHFGHQNLVECHRLLASLSPKDVLVFTAVRLSRAYVVRAVLLAYSNRIWKNSMLFLCTAAFLYEVYALATTDIRLPQSEIAVSSLFDNLTLYRHIGFMAAAALAVFLPAKSPAKPLSPEEASLVQGVHALMQRQDMLQTRIRVIEAVLSPHIKKEGEQKASYLSPAQKNSLKAWLRTIVEEEDGQVRDIPVVKVEEVESDEIFIQPKEEETTLESQPLRLLKAESVDPMDSVEESYATAAQVVIKRSSSEDSLLSPTLSRSSSSSSPIDTPTPAMRRPMSTELASTTAAQLREVLNEEEDTSLDLDQPLNKRHDLTNRLTQSLGPSGLVPQRDLLFEVDGPQIEKPHRRSFSMYGVIPGIREPEVVDDRADELSEISEMQPNSPAVGNTSMPWLEDNRVQGPTDSSPISASTNLQPDQDEGSKPVSTSPDQASQSHYYDSAPLFGQSDDDGWTTVLSKKSRNKIQ